jgi:hypothetical protein
MMASCLVSFEHTIRVRAIFVNSLNLVDYQIEYWTSFVLLVLFYKSR